MNPKIKFECEFDQTFTARVVDGNLFFECNVCRKLFPSDTPVQKFRMEILKHQFFIDQEAETKRLKEHFKCPVCGGELPWELLKHQTNNSNSISPKSQLSKDNLSTCGVDEKQQE